MTSPQVPPGFARGMPVPAREVSQTGDIGTLTDAQGQPIRTAAGAATIADSGYLLNQHLAPRAHDVNGLTPRLGLQAEVQVMRQAFSEVTRNLQAELHNSLRPHTQAVQESVQVQRQNLQEQRALTQALREAAATTGGSTSGGTPGPTGGGPTGPGTALPSSATDQPRPAGAAAEPGFHRFGESFRRQMRNAPPNSAQPDPHDPNDPIAIQRQQVSALEERFGDLGSVGGRAMTRVLPEGDQNQVIGIREGYESGFRSLRGSSARMLSPLARRMQRYQAPNTPDLIQDPNGNFRVRNTGRVSLEHGVPNTPDRLASGGELEQFIQGSARTGLVRGAGLRIGEMGIAGIPGIGEAAVGVGVAHQAIGMFERQREENRGYQAIEGGSNAGGIAERGRESMFGFSQMGVMSGGQARELFQGATAAGYRGSERNNALSLATEQFRRNGTDIAQTLQLMTVAAQTGGKSLTGVNAALNDLTDLARRNGQNAAELRQQFVQNFASGAQVYGSQGGTNAAVASIETQMTAGQGERFAGVSAAGMNTDISARMQASSMGMQIGRYIGAAQRDPNVRAQGMSNLVQRTATQALGSQAPAMQQQLQRLREEHPDGRVPEEDIRRLSDQLLNSGTFDPGGAARLEGARGIPGVTDQNAAEMVVRQASGAADPATIQKQRVADASPRAATPGDLSFQRKVMGGDVDQSARRSHGWFSGVRHFVLGNSNTEGGSAADAYGKAVQSSGQVHPVVEKLLQMGIGKNDARIRVNTKGGARDVTFADAVKNYADQLDTGQNTIVGGPQNGQSISAITGMGTGADPTQAGSASDDKLATHGKKDDPNKGSGDGGTVTISPTPLLQQMFNFSGTGNVAINAGRDTGTAPSSNVTPQQMPVGGH